MTLRAKTLALFFKKVIMKISSGDMVAPHKDTGKYTDVFCVLG